MDKVSKETRSKIMDLSRHNPSWKHSSPKVYGIKGLDL